HGVDAGQHGAGDEAHDETHDEGPKDVEHGDLLSPPALSLRASLPGPAGLVTWGSLARIEFSRRRWSGGARAFDGSGLAVLRGMPRRLRGGGTPSRSRRGIRVEDDAGASGVPRSAARRGRAAGARRAADSAAAPPAREAGTDSAGCAAPPVAEAPGSACPCTGADTWGPGRRAA